MNIERLKMLSTLLRKPVPVDGVAGFDMYSWSAKYEASVQDYVHIFDEKNTCGTTCCALGLAGVAPEFRSLGLIHDPKKWAEGGFPFTVCGKVMMGIEAAQEFFGLSWSDSFRLFGGPEWYHDSGSVPDEAPVKPSHVADVIDHLIKHGELPDGTE